MVARTIDSTVENNTIEHARFSGTGRGAALEVTGNDLEGSCNNILISKNTVFHGYEGIGIYKKAENIVVADNTVYDCDSYMIYVDAAKNIDIIKNLVYSSSEASKWGGPSVGISINNEEARPYCFTGPIYIAGNKIAGCKYGLNLGLQEMNDDPNCSWDNVLIENNIIVECAISNLQFWTTSQNWTFSIKNNISYIVSDESKHSNNYSPIGITWDNNTFSSVVSGNAANNASISKVLFKQSGWESLPAGDVDLDYFTVSNTAFYKSSIYPPINVKAN
jgi:parallel beta-helix repeat protein